MRKKDNSLPCFQDLSIHSINNIKTANIINSKYIKFLQNDRPDLSSEGAPDIDKTVNVNRN
jgi:hypothetical protein